MNPYGLLSGSHAVCCSQGMATIVIVNVRMLLCLCNLAQCPKELLYGSITQPWQKTGLATVNEMMLDRICPDRSNPTAQIRGLCNGTFGQLPRRWEAVRLDKTYHTVSHLCVFRRHKSQLSNHTLILLPPYTTNSVPIGSQCQLGKYAKRTLKSNSTCDPFKQNAKPVAAGSTISTFGTTSEGRKIESQMAIPRMPVKIITFQETIRIQQGWKFLPWWQAITVALASIQPAVQFIASADKDSRSLKKATTSSSRLQVKQCSLFRYVSRNTLTCLEVWRNGRLLERNLCAIGATHVR